MQFAVIGAGVIGTVHAGAISTLGAPARLALVADEIPERAAKLARAYGAEHTSSAADAFARDDIEAVAICTPSGTHAELAVAALKAGKHLIVEKPIDVTPAAAAAIMRSEAEAAAQGPAVVTVISQHRFDPASQVVHRAVREGRFGRITSGLASIAWWRSQDYYDSGAWRGTWALDGGGALMNQGVHTVDLLVWLLGDPVEVYAHTARLAHERIEVEDTAVATITFAGGALGIVHATTAAYPGLTARLQVHGDRGSAIIDGDRLAYFHTAAGDGAAADDGADGDVNQVAAGLLEPSAPNPSAGSDPAALSDAHAAQYRDFLDAIEAGRPPLVTTAQAARTLAVIHAIYDSARTGRPVTVALPDRLPGLAPGDAPAPVKG